MLFVCALPKVRKELKHSFSLSVNWHLENGCFLMTCSIFVLFMMSRILPSNYLIKAFVFKWKLQIVISQNHGKMNSKRAAGVAKCGTEHILSGLAKAQFAKVSKCIYLNVCICQGLPMLFTTIDMVEFYVNFLVPKIYFQQRCAVWLENRNMDLNWLNRKLS